MNSRKIFGVFGSDTDGLVDAVAVAFVLNRFWLWPKSTKVLCYISTRLCWLSEFGGRPAGGPSGDRASFPPQS